MAKLTYSTKEMHDTENRFGVPWSAGTLRVFHADERQCWSVCLRGCDNYGTAICCWADGEVFDGKQWCPIAEFTEADIRRIVREELEKGAKG